jgi:hypothetical protein
MKKRRSRFPSGMKKKKKGRSRFPAGTTKKKQRTD